MQTRKFYDHATGYWKYDSVSARKNNCDQMPDPCIPRITCGQKGEKGAPGNATTAFSCHTVAVRSPTTVIEITPTVEPGLLLESNNNFTAQQMMYDLTNWTPQIAFDPTLFDLATGTYSVVDPGDYMHSVVIDYRTSQPLAIADLTLIPTVEIYDVDTGLRVPGLVAQFPVTHIVIPPVISGDPGIDISVILTTGQIVINTLASHVANQRLRIRVIVAGLTPVDAVSTFANIHPLQILNATIVFNAVGSTTWTITKQRNTSVFNFVCNN